jgi:hypothetical protein
MMSILINLCIGRKYQIRYDNGDEQSSWQGSFLGSRITKKSVFNNAGRLELIFDVDGSSVELAIAQWMLANGWSIAELHQEEGNDDG